MSEAKCAAGLSQGAFRPRRPHAPYGLASSALFVWKRWEELSAAGDVAKGISLLDDDNPASWPAGLANFLSAGDVTADRAQLPAAGAGGLVMSLQLQLYFVPLLEFASLQMKKMQEDVLINNVNSILSNSSGVTNAILDGVNNRPGGQFAFTKPWVEHSLSHLGLSTEEFRKAMELMRPYGFVR